MGASAFLLCGPILFEEIIAKGSHLKFLFLCNSLNIGGIETYILRFAKWMKRTHSDNELHVVCKSGKFGSYEKDYRMIGIHLHAMPLGYFNPLPYAKFYTFLKRFSFDAMCDFTGDFGAPTIFCAYCAQISRRLIFYRCARNAYKFTLYRKVYQRISNRIVRILSTKVLSNSEDAFQYFFAGYAFMQDRRFEIVRNGIPKILPITMDEKIKICHELDILPAQKIVLHVGGASWIKNHECILKIAKYAQNDDMNVWFCFAGMGVAEKYAELARRMELKNTKFLGLRKDVSNLLQIADVFLFPSFSEGQPNSLLEAIFSGLPFLASDIVPIRESLSPEWGDQWLFSPNDPEKGYLLLKNFLNAGIKHDEQFQKLIDWSKKEYSENKCFGALFYALKS